MALVSLPDHVERIKKQLGTGSCKLCCPTPYRIILNCILCSRKKDSGFDPFPYSLSYSYIKKSPVGPIANQPLAKQQFCESGRNSDIYAIFRFLLQFFSPFKSNKLREPGRNCGTCANATLQCMWLRVKWENKSFSDANLRNWCNGTPRPQTQWKHSKKDSTARHPNIQYLKMLFMGILGFFGFGNFVDMMSYRRGWKWISQG